jgi:polyhydroxyalkanoate synthesis regulator phasin
MPSRPTQAGPSDALRAAVERTFAATAGSAAGTRERAAELLDEVVRRGDEVRQEAVRRGQEVRDEAVKRGQEARREVTRRGEEVARKGQEVRDEAVRRGQEARDEVMRRVEVELGAISDRLEQLEAALRKGKS